ncbi:PHP domain-containing protein [Streptomyces sp. 130]|uniref:PHP domain-containing protein n=1 Tax=Streptomyces sp. 130 TaxID=2591006 RepID=UPI00163D72A4|nr:PHP domain-containing protein [Streptomyces sp. 130]
MLRVDHHTHSTFSDGRSTVLDMVRAAAAAGLRTLYVTDHVRRDTDWLPEYTAAVRAAAAQAGPLTVVCGVEAKILDTEGRLDLPADLTGVEHVAIADHRFPTPEGPVAPAEIADLLAGSRIRSDDALDAVTEAIVAAVHQVPTGLSAHLAHLFSVLPKAGLDERAVGAARLGRIAAACRRTDTAVEINEKWRCPSAATAGVLRDLGVRLVAGSDAHIAADIGAWDFAAQVLRAQRAAHPPFGTSDAPRVPGER